MTLTSDLFPTPRVCQTFHPGRTSLNHPINSKKNAQSFSTAAVLSVTERLNTARFGEKYGLPQTIHNFLAKNMGGKLSDLLILDEMILDRESFHQNSPEWSHAEGANVDSFPTQYAKHFPQTKKIVGGFNLFVQIFYSHIWSLPQIGIKINRLWNHHLVWQK